MPSKRGTPKKQNHAKFFTSPRRIDKRSRRTNKGAGWGVHRSEIGAGYDRPDTRKQNQINQYRRTRALHKSQDKQSRKALSIKPVNKRRQDGKVKECKDSRTNRNGKENKTKHKTKQPKVSPTPTPTPTPAPPPQQEDNVRVFALGHFHQLMQVVTPGSLVVLDIDETLIITRNMPSLLLESSGVIQFQKHIQKLFPDFSSRNMHCRRLQEAIKEKTLVEEQTANTIRQLQARQCRIFALTARYSELAERTERVLGDVGISFVKSAPFPKHPIQDPVTEAVVMNGIVYCNGQDKGRILSRLLSSVILPREQKEQASGVVKLPIGGLHFVDDRLEHTLSVRNALQAFPSLDIPSICFHYRSPTAMQQEAQRDLASSHPGLLSFIMDHFVTHGRLLTNTKALEMMANPTTTTPSHAEASSDEHQK